VQQSLPERNILVITHLAPSVFWLFPTLKTGLKGAHFTTMEDIKSNVMAKLQKVQKEVLRWCFQEWQDEWSKCVYAQGSYFEGD
jgi:hypothetical protein